jgi:NADPH-dependent 2,4-dienoyl-CoA reductase/sulfur reductase-like enzyme
VVVGAVAAGASAAAKARRTGEDVEIVLVEAGPYMSYANCGLPYYLGGEIAERNSLFVVDASAFARRFDAEVRLGTWVERVAVDR